MVRQCAKDIDVGWDGSVWIAGSSANNAIGNSGWVRVDGIADMITVNNQGTPWAINTNKDIFKRDK